MGHVQAETRRGWGLGGSPEGDWRGLSLVDARREGPMVGSPQSLVVLALLRGPTRECQSPPRRDRRDAVDVA